MNDCINTVETTIRNNLNIGQTKYFGRTNRKRRAFHLSSKISLFDIEIPGDTYKLKGNRPTKSFWFHRNEKAKQKSKKICVDENDKQLIEDLTESVVSQCYRSYFCLHCTRQKEFVH